MVPYNQNPQFTGREDVLEQLEVALSQGNSAALTQPQAIRGLGGIGKTQTAVEYAYRHCKDYDAVFWVRAELQEELISGFVEIAKVLQLPEKDAQDQTLIVAAVKKWLNTHEHWLLILDNADNLTIARDFLPSGPQGHVLLTTRESATGQIAQAVELKKMSHHDGALFLLRRSKLIANQSEWEAATESDQQVALEIAKEMDGLPLALDQAGAFVEEMMLSLTEYLNLYRQEGAKLLAERGELASDDHPSVTVTFRLAFTKVEERSPTAADLLRVCAFLAPDNIPEEIFTESASVLSEPLGTVTENALNFAKTVREAGRFSLIERNRNTQTLSIHRLVQEVLKAEMEPNMRQDCLLQTIVAVDQAFPNPEFENWMLCESLLPHVVMLLTFEDIESYGLMVLNTLFSRTGLYLRQRGQYTSAETFLARSLLICEQYFGSNSFAVARDSSNLAAVYSSQGRYEEAELLLVRSLNVEEEQLDQNDYYLIATCFNNLAEVYRIQGHYGAAKSLYIRSISMTEKLFGPEYLNLATILNNLALNYESQGIYGEAESSYIRSLSILEKQLSPEHPRIADILSNLAALYYIQERYGESEMFQKRALKIMEQQLGSNHHLVAFSLNNLGSLYMSQGHHAEAETLFERSLSIREQQLGSNHPEVATSLNNLGSLYMSQGHHAEAETLFERSLSIREQQLGSTHPDVAGSFINLAELYKSQGRYTKAELFYLKGLKIWAQLIESQEFVHPNLQTGLQNFYGFVAQIIQEGRQAELSDHPTTQAFLEQLQSDADAGQS
jgi:tetratricopeptide (TPR) repeat protein